MSNYYIIRKSDWVFGFVFLAIVMFFGFKILFLGTTNLNLSGHNYYYIDAIFMDASGVEKQSVVRINGVDIGRVESITLKNDYLAIVNLAIKSEIKIPSDSSISIGTSSLIGRKFVNVIPGTSDIPIKNGDSISLTSNITWDQIISRLISSSSSSRKFIN